MAHRRTRARWISSAERPRVIPPHPSCVFRGKSDSSPNQIGHRSVSIRTGFHELSGHIFSTVQTKSTTPNRPTQPPAENVSRRDAEPQRTRIPPLSASAALREILFPFRLFPKIAKPPTLPICVHPRFPSHTPTALCHTARGCAGCRTTPGPCHIAFPTPNGVVPSPDPGEVRPKRPSWQIPHAGQRTTPHYVFHFATNPEQGKPPVRSIGTTRSGVVTNLPPTPGVTPPTA